MNESQFSREIRKSLDKFGYFKKMVGGMYIVPGIPDILGCYKGRFIGIECKQIKTLPKKDTSLLWNCIFKEDQILNLKEINQNGGVGLGLVHINENPRQQYAAILTVEHVESFKSITVRGFKDQIINGTLFTISKAQGYWAVLDILNNLDRF